MPDDISLNEFAGIMGSILVEKYPKYKNTWRTVNLNILREKLDEQIKKISTIITSKIDWDKKEVKKRFVHVANIAYLIYNRL